MMNCFRCFQPRCAIAPFVMMCTVILTLSSTANAEQLALEVNAEAAILMNADTGAILYEKNAHNPHFPASITKIATASYALKMARDKLDAGIAADQDCIGTVTEEALRRSNYTLPAYFLIPDGSHIGIKKGEVLSLRDLLYGMMLASGDDAANVIAKYVGGTIPQFMQAMNEYVKQAGCLETTFYNPHGLHHPKQQTTAYDMAMLARTAIKDPLFCEIVSTVRYTRPKTNKQEPTVLMQTNRLLRSGPYFYPKAIGIKTGYYSTAGSTLVAAARDGDRTLIAVLLKVQDRKDIFLDSKKMFEAAFNQPMVERILVKQGPHKFELNLPGAVRPIHTLTTEDLALAYYPAEEPKVKCLLYWDKEVQLPVSKMQSVGEIALQLENGQVLAKTTLYAQDDVKATWIFRMKTFFNQGLGGTLLKIFGFILIMSFLGIVGMQLRKN